MRTEDFIDLLQKTQSTGQVLLSEHEVRLASQSRFVLIRSIVGEILFYYPKSFADSLSLSLLLDKNSEVRSSAAIGLSNHNKREVFIALKETFMNDKSSVVKAYAGRSFVNNDCFDRSYIPCIEEFLLRQKSYLVRALCYGELYKKFSETKHLYELVKCFNSRIYQTRIAVLNILEDVLNGFNANYIFHAISCMKEKEELDIIKQKIFLLQEKIKTGGFSLS